MKNFKVGDRVAFDFGKFRLRGEIVNLKVLGKLKNAIQTKDCFNETTHISIESCTNIKRLVKKKRLTIWVNDCGNYLSTPFTNEYEAKNRAKQSPTFVRTIKFRECK